MTVRMPSGTGSPQRLPWIDMARGFCVMAVVLLHLGLFHVFPLSPDPHRNPVTRAWVLFNTAVLAELRMPLLLLLSGYLARTKARAGWSLPRTRSTVVANLYLYVVWTLVYFALGVLFYPVVGGQPFATWSFAGLAVSLAYPQTGPLWFVYVLGLSLAALACTRRLPRPVVIAGFLLVGWAALMITDQVAGLPRAVFFAVGALYGDRLIDWTRSWVISSIAFLGYVVLLVVGESGVLGQALGYPVMVLGGLMAAVAFLALARLVAHVPVLLRPGAWVGRRTLGIYVLHWPLVGLITWMGTRHAAQLRSLFGSPAVEIAYPVVLAGLVIAICMGLEHLLKAVGLGWLFVTPAWLTRLVTGAGARASSRAAADRPASPLGSPNPR